MSSKIKGGGRAIMSAESQGALVDLLMGFDGEFREKYGDGELSAHDRKRARKKFVRRLMQRHERRRLRARFNASSGGEAPSASSAAEPNGRRNNSQPAAASQSSSASTGGPNVRIELVEAIFKGGGDKKDKKRKGGGKDKDKKNGKKSNKSSSSSSSTESNSFTAGAKKVAVFPRSTTITELLQKSKARLKLKKTPVRAFVLVDDSSALFDLDADLTAVEDGAAVYVAATPPPPPPPPPPRSAKGGRGEDDGASGEDEGGGDDDAPDGDVAETTEVDPLESVKRAYRRREVRDDRPKRGLERVPEIVDADGRASMEALRATLPVSSHRERILDAVRDNPVVVLSGATGSGKSTQVPQFLLEGGRRDGGRRPYVVVTQPRRVAAVSLAHRVAEERGCPPPGERGSSVGYVVRSDRRVDLRSCRIIYVTVGVLLRMLVNRGRGAAGDEGGVGDSCGGDGDGIVPPLSIDAVSHLIIDETHERDVNTDFSLTLLRGMISSSLSSSSAAHVPRLILMSATASSELFCSYFGSKGVSPVAIEVPGKTFPVDCKWLSECERFAGRTMTTTRGGGGRDEEGGREAGRAADDGDGEKNAAGKLSPRATEEIDNRFIRSLIVALVRQQQSDGSLSRDASSFAGSRRATGAILVFLPGMGEIESLARCLLEEGTIASDRDLCKVAKLHSSVPKAEQRHVFRPALRGTVKIVLSTNIAETSVTIPDVSHVIDACRVKESRYNPSARIKELVTVWASRASMKQRAGRAGRTSRGTCWRLCSEEFAEGELPPHTVPEMARTPLDELILQIGLLYERRRDEYYCDRAEGEGGNNERAFAPGFKPVKFLSMTPTPPSERGLIRASRHLLEVGALKVVEAAGEEIDWLYRLTPLGYHLSRLPMDAKVGKMLIVGCLLGCLDNALTIAAALSCAKSCFFRGRADPACVEARDSLIEDGFGGRGWPGGTAKGDSIAAIAAYRAWEGRGRRDRGAFCRRHALDDIALGEMEALRGQFSDLIVDAGLAPESDGRDSSEDDDRDPAGDDASLTGCCLVAGLYPNIAALVRPRREGPRGGRLLTNDGDGTCRPSSGSFQRSRVERASETGKDAYAVYHAKHRSLGTVSSGQKRQPETFLSEVNFVSKFALLLFGGELELANNAIVVDGWLKFKVSSDEEGARQNAVLILSLRELLDEAILEHVVETFSSPGEKAEMVVRHRKIIAVVRRVLSDEG